MGVGCAYLIFASTRCPQPAAADLCTRNISMKATILPLTLLVFSIVSVYLVVPGRATLCPRGESSFFMHVSA